MVSIIGIMGAMVALGGSVGFFIFPAGLSMGIKMFINLAENGMVFPLYMNPPIGPISTYHLFAVKNPREILQGKKPVLELKGPYVFNSILVRDRIEFNKDGEKVSFGSGRMLAWDEQSSANPDEQMWVVSPILPGVAITVRSLIIDRIPFKRLAEPVVYNAANLLVDNYKERLIMKTTPRGVMDGRKIHLLEDLTSLAKRFGVGSLLPPGPPDNIFGLAHVQNKTIEPLELWVGVGKTRAKYAEVSKFRGKEKLTAWRGKCNSISGTNGELYKPFVEPGKAIRVFLGPLCRSFNLEPASDGLVPTSSGIMALEYEMTPRLFQGARTNPYNKCFCKDTRTYDCQYDGLIFMGPCFFDAPLYFAKPNFKLADPKIADLVDMSGARRPNNSEPNWELSDRQTFWIEPITGTALEANLNLMATFKIVRQPYLRDLDKVQSLTYMPMFVVNEDIKLPFKYVWQIYYLQKLNDYYKPIMAGVAASGLGVVVLKFLFG